MTLGAEYPQFLKKNPNYIDKKELFIEWVFKKHGIMLDYDWYDENYDKDEDDDMSEEDYKNQYISMQENDEEFDKKNKGKIQCVECGEFKEPDIIKVVDWKYGEKEFLCQSCSDLIDEYISNAKNNQGLDWNIPGVDD